MTECELMWVAGLLEGEGCFRLYRDTQRWGNRKYVYLRPRIVCAMTDKDVIERLHKLTGVGRISLGRKTNPGYKPYWQWTVSRDGDALELMRTVYPHMGARRSAKIEEIHTWWRITELLPRGNRRRSPRRIAATTETTSVADRP